jgi:hypothetical protein
MPEHEREVDAQSRGHRTRIGDRGRNADETGTQPEGAEHRDEDLVGGERRFGNDMEGSQDDPFEVGEDDEERVRGKDELRFADSAGVSDGESDRVEVGEKAGDELGSPARGRWHAAPQDAVTGQHRRAGRAGHPEQASAASDSRTSGR